MKQFKQFFLILCLTIVGGVSNAWAQTENTVTINNLVYELINRDEKKYEPSIMIGGGICSKGLSRPILVENTVNEFAYAQALLFYKEDFDRLKYNSINLYFE